MSFGWFGFFGFPVKCAEAGWLLEVGFLCMLLVAVTLDTDIAILSFLNVSFGRPGASTLAPWGYFGCFGTPWGTIGAAGRTRGVSESHF